MIVNPAFAINALGIQTPLGCILPFKAAPKEHPKATSAAIIMSVILSLIWLTLRLNPLTFAGSEQVPAIKSACPAEQAHLDCRCKDEK